MTVKLKFDPKAFDAIFRPIDQTGLPGLAVGIAFQGQPVYRRGFGLASIELPVTLSPSMRMRVFSSTKQFTCLAYLLLCEQRRATLDSPVGNFLPELNNVSGSTTMRQLMSHTSGLRDANDILWLFSGTECRVSNKQLVALYSGLEDTNFPADTSWCYNNGGYQLLTLAIERITGESFEDVLGRLIFEPVGMHDTLVRRWDTSFVPNSATLHARTSEGAYERLYLANAMVGDGGVVSTVDDMLRWLAHMDKPRIGGRETWQALVTPQTLNNGASTRYGLGLMRGHYRGVETLYHSGSGLGGNCQMLKIPSHRLDIVILANRSDISSISLSYALVDLCIADLAPVPAPFSSPISGLFRSPSTGRVISLQRSAVDNLPWIRAGGVTAIIDGSTVRLEADAHGSLRPSQLYGWSPVLIRPVGKLDDPDSIILEGFGIEDRLLREFPSEDEGVIDGSYISEDTDTTLVIASAKGATSLRSDGRYGCNEFSLDHVGKGIWRATARGGLPFGGLLEFEARNIAFQFSSDRTRRLRFVREA